MGKAKACDACSLRKIRCSGECPCVPCVKARFDCSFAKTRMKPGPKGPRTTTSNQIRKKLHDIRSQAAISTTGSSPRPGTISATTRSLSPYLPESSSRPSPIRWTLLPTLSPATPDAPQISFQDVSAYLKIYHDRMYAVWPVVDVTELLARLSKRTQDWEAYALAYSVCAATGAQLRLADFEPEPSQNGFNTADRFAAEAERCRAMLDHSKNATVALITIPFFLHHYYSTKQNQFASTILLRESLTFCELLHLDKETVYATLELEEQRYRRKVFWLLFITERGNAMQNDLSTVLRASIGLPKAEDDKYPILFPGFLSLVRLFVAVEGILTGSESNSNDRMFTTETFSTLQEQIQNNPAQSIDETQRTDLCVTKHWMQMLIWQLAMKKVSMTAGPPEDPLSLTYPAHVAKDSVAFLTSVSLSSIVAHGPGMELKIFEIANSLLDVINCVPSLTIAKPGLMTQGPRDIVHALSGLLATVSSGNSKSLALLRGKMAATNNRFQQIPRLIELEDSPARSPASLEPTSANSLTETSSEPETKQLNRALTSTPFWLDKASNDSTTNLWLDGSDPPEFLRAGFLNHAEHHPSLDATPFREHEMSWSFGIT